MNEAGKNEAGKKRAIATAAVIALLLATTAAANPRKEKATHGPGFQGKLDFRKLDASPERVFPPIRYDTGVFTGVGDIPAIPDNFSFGNTFGPCALPFSVTFLSFFMGIVDSSTTGSGNAFVTVFAPLNTAGTNASPLFSVSTPLQANAFNTVSLFVPFTGTGSVTFLAGIWNPTAGSTAGPTPCAVDCVGFDTNKGGLGFHGFAMEDFGGGNFQAIPDANAILRAGGAHIPVELMTFTID